MKRTEGTIRDNATGQTYRVSKGAPHVLLTLVASSVPSEESDSHHHIEELVEKDVIQLGERGIRCLAVAKTDPGTGRWRILGLLTFLDPPRPDTKKVLFLLKATPPPSHFLYLNDCRLSPMLVDMVCK